MYLCQIKHTLTLNKINALTQKYLYFPLAHCKGLPYFCLHFHTIYWADPELPNDTAQALQGCIPWQFIPSWAPHEPSISSKPQASACYEAQGRYETTIPYSKYFQRAHGDTAAQPEKAWGEEKRKAERRRGSHPSASSLSTTHRMPSLRHLNRGGRIFFPNITGCWRGATTWLFSATQCTVFTINNNSKQKQSQKSKLGTLELGLHILISPMETV